MSGACYSWNPDKQTAVITDPNWNKPCPVGQGCCVPGDSCVGDFMCKRRAAAAFIDVYYGDYYVGGCTDSTYSDVACSQYCFREGRTDIVYDSKADEWVCCGSFTTGIGPPIPTCNRVTNVTFSFTAPAQLVAKGVAGGSASSSSSSSSSSSLSTSRPTGVTTNNTSSTTSTSIPSNNPSPAKGLNGAGVGLGVGLGLGISLITAAIILILIQRRQRRRRHCSRNVDATAAPIPYHPDAQTAHTKHSFFTSTAGRTPQSHRAYMSSSSSSPLRSHKPTEMVRVHEFDGGDNTWDQQRSELPSSRH